MFTGLVEEIGTVKTMLKGRNSYELTITANKILDDLKVGDSVCTQGACLTVTEIRNHEFTVDVMSETVIRTNFSQLKPGHHVNLERAMKLSDRLGGHLVSGHIDGTGTIASITKDDIAHRFSITAEVALIQQLIPKGSIAIDGISLTLVTVNAQSFEMSVIPHTASKTTLLHKKVNDTVNIETDMIGKFVYRFLQTNQTQNNNQNKSSIDMGFLAKNGFL